MKQALLAVVFALGIALAGCDTGTSKTSKTSYAGERGYYYSSSAMDSDYDVDQSGWAYHAEGQCPPKAKTECPPAKTEKPAKTEPRQEFRGEECPSRDYWADLEPQPLPKPAGMAHVGIVTGITQINYRVDVTNVGKITGATLHLGMGEGKLGPAVVVFKNDAFKTVNEKTSLARGTIAQSDLVGPLQGKNLSVLADEIRNGNAFVKVTTEDRPEGILVGKLSLDMPPEETRSMFVGESKDTSANPKDASIKNENADRSLYSGENSLDGSKMFFAAEDRGPVFHAVLMPPAEIKDARADLWLEANKAQDKLHYRLNVDKVSDVTGANLYLVEKPATPAAEIRVSDAGVRAETPGIITNLGEPILKLYDGPKKEGSFTGMLSEGDITKDNLMGALKDKDVSALLDHIRQGHVFVAVMTDKFPDGRFQGVVRLQEMKTEAK